MGLPATFKLRRQIKPILANDPEASGVTTADASEPAPKAALKGTPLHNQGQVNVRLSAAQQRRNAARKKLQADLAKATADLHALNQKFRAEQAAVRQANPSPAGAGDDIELTLAKSEREFLAPAVRMLNELRRYPSQYVDTSFRQLTAQFGIEAFRGLGLVLANGARVAISKKYKTKFQPLQKNDGTVQLVPVPATALVRFAEGGIYATGGFVWDALTVDLASFAARKIGSEYKAYFSPSGQRSAVGDFNEVTANLVLDLVRNLAYAAVTSGLSHDDIFNGHVAPGKAAIGVLLNAAAKTGMMAGLNQLTLWQAGVKSHADLPTVRNNHSLPRFAVYQVKPVALADRTTPKEKTVEVAIRTGISLFNRLVFTALQTANKADPVKNPVVYQVQTLFLSNQVASLFGSLASYMAVRLYSDRTRHRRHFSTVARQVLGPQLRSSAMDQRSAVLNQMSLLLDTPMDVVSAPPVASSSTAAAPAASMDNDLRRLFQTAFNMVSSGAANALVAASRNGDAAGIALASLDFDRFKDFIADAKDRAVQEGIGLMQQPTPDYSKLAMLGHIQERFDFILNDITKGKALAASGGYYGATVTDMVQNLRRLSATLTQMDFRPQIESEDSEAVAHDTFATDLASTFMPVFAAIRKLDRRARADEVMKALELAIHNTGQGRIKQLDFVLTAFEGPQELSVFARDIHSQIEEIEGRAGGIGSEVSPRDMIIQSLEIMLDHEHVASHKVARLRAAVLLGQLRQAKGTVPAAEGSGAEQNALDRFTEGWPRVSGAFPMSHDKAFDGFIGDVASGTLNLRTLVNTIRQDRDVNMFGEAVPRITELDGTDLEAQEIEENHGVRAFVDMAGEALVSVLAEEAGDLTINHQLGARMLERSMDDLFSMHHVIRDSFIQAFGLPRSPLLRKLALALRFDAHQHETNFNKLRIMLETQIATNKVANIGKRAIMPIPNDIRHPTDFVKYYGVTEQSWDVQKKETRYYDQWKNLDPTIQDSTVIALTGLTLLNKEKVSDEIAEGFMDAPEGMIKWVGEISVHKTGGLTDAAPGGKVPDFDELAHPILIRAALLGLGVTAHHDIGGPAPWKWDKPGTWLTNDPIMHVDTIVNTALSAVQALKSSRYDDPMRRIGNYVPPVLKLVIPHFGISPQNAGGPDLTAKWVEMFKIKALEEHLNVDASWSVTAFALLRSLRDSLNRAKLSKPMQRALDDVVIGYEAFLKIGGLSDLETDVRRPDTAAHIHEAATAALEVLLGLHDDFEAVVRAEIVKPGVYDGLMDMLKKHGDGNNILYLFANFSKRIIFGTDNLGTEVKIHGQQELLADALATNPILAIFNGLATMTKARDPNRADPKAIVTLPDGGDVDLGQIEERFLRTNFEDTFLNKSLAERRSFAYTSLHQNAKSHGRRETGNVSEHVEDRVQARFDYADQAGPDTPDDADNSDQAPPNTIAAVDPNQDASSATTVQPGPVTPPVLPPSLPPQVTTSVAPPVSPQDTPPQVVVPPQTPQVDATPPMPPQVVATPQTPQSPAPAAPSRQPIFAVARPANLAPDLDQAAISRLMGFHLTEDEAERDLSEADLAGLRG